MCVSHNTEVHLCNYCCSRRAKSITYSKSVCLVCILRYPACNAQAVICDLSDSTIFFYIISSMARFLKNKVTENKMCVLSLQLLSETFLIPRRTERDMIKTVYRSSRTAPLVLSIFNKTGIFSADFPKKNFMKRCQLGAESFQADRHDAGDSCFSQFYECT